MATEKKQSKAGGRKAAPRKSAGRKPAAKKTAERKAADHPLPEGVLERGDVFFVYRPDVGEEAPGGLVDVARFHIVLRPEGGEALRLITVGRKALPEAEGEGGGAGGRNWAFVDRVFDDPAGLRGYLSGEEYETDTRGDRHRPAARAAGEGVYALARAGRDTVLAYVLELPEEPGEVQRAFRIAREGRFVVSVKNPEGGSPAGAGLDADRRAEFPAELAEKFGGRKWLPADPPAFLDHEGAELVLIAGRAGDPPGPDDADFGLEPEAEDAEHSELFEALRLEAGARSARPLFEGTWA